MERVVIREVNDIITLLKLTCMFIVFFIEGFKFKGFRVVNKVLIMGQDTKVSDTSCENTRKDDGAGDNIEHGKENECNGNSSHKGIFLLFQKAIVFFDNFFVCYVISNHEKSSLRV